MIPVLLGQSNLSQLPLGMQTPRLRSRGIRVSPSEREFDSHCVPVEFLYGVADLMIVGSALYFGEALELETGDNIGCYYLWNGRDECVESCSSDSYVDGWLR